MLTKFKSSGIIKAKAEDLIMDVAKAANVVLESAITLIHKDPAEALKNVRTKLETAPSATADNYVTIQYLA